ncbi:hypothetical protein FM102_05230 [Corynebacterium glutamicum]|nr:hypothetical protein FM102_05230 [Corynebacterium glutamicum]
MQKSVPDNSEKADFDRRFALMGPQYANTRSILGFCCDL